MNKADKTKTPWDLKIGSVLSFMCGDSDGADLFCGGAGVGVTVLCGGHDAGVYPFSLAESAG